MRNSCCTFRSRACLSRMLSSGLPAVAAAVLLLLQPGEAAAQVQTMGNAPPPSGTLSVPPGQRTVSSKPVNSAPVSSRPLGSTPALPSAPVALPSVASGGSTPASAWSGTSVSQGAPLPTFASPRRAPAPVPAGGIGTAALPFADPVIDTQKRRFPLAPDRRHD